MTTQDEKRVNEGWLQPLERPALLWLAPRMPPWITPDRLTAIGFLGTVICCAGYVIAAYDLSGLWLASLGLIVNWFGDSLDGTLARHRRIERPRYGYFLDNMIDVVQQLMGAVAVGMSGLVRWDLCFLAFGAFLMMSVLALVRAKVSGHFQMAFGGSGPTEIRALAIVSNAVMFLYPPHRLDWLGLPMTYPNMLSLLWSSITILTFLIVFVSVLRELAVEDPPRA